ncbi:MFS transporter [Brumicola nitratireducens]|uniref:Twin-arginine translocation pathway signal n=1 Tax=Glaciecola nitratireducens (strain JCM 12485 / KCTC 12276 / FR1064) TaxID=1085623 RepID=G4QJE0_GLANF|nr:MFS transporter [Glaciecola nitratireducens]AEP28546.1 Twin-arginine translocation pathway signal [Glaciecola nitratireducens FR1064]
MLRALVPISALLLSNAFLLLGHGLLLTLLPIAASTAGFSDTQVALTGSAYFLGFVSGCLATPYMLKRVGHIRSFAVLATCYSVVILIFPLLPEFYSWMILRFFIGVAISGLYMIIESWLNGSSDAKNRGSILSVYTTLNFVMVMSGQQLLNLGNTQDWMLFGLAAIFVSIAIIPVSLTLSAAPAAIHQVKVNMFKVWQHSHIALIGAVVTGLVTGAFWSLAPIYAKDNGFESSQLAAFVSATVLGGACFQLPLGKVSDRFDRRIVLMYLALAGAAVSLLFVGLPYVVTTFGGWPAAISAFFWGGTCMTLYAICLAHANDNATSDDFVEISSAMLITLGLSSAIGAPLASLAMSLMGANGLYAFTSVCLITFFIIVVLRRRSHELPFDLETKDNFRAVTEMTGPAAFEMDPRTEVDHK